MIQITFPIKTCVKNDVSHTINGLLLKRYIHLRPWRPFWIYANYKNFPKVSIPATKLNIFYRPMRVWNHQKTIHFSWQQGSLWKA